MADLEHPGDHWLFRPLVPVTNSTPAHPQLATQTSATRIAEYFATAERAATPAPPDEVVPPESSAEVTALIAATGITDGLWHRVDLEYAPLADPELALWITRCGHLATRSTDTTARANPCPQCWPNGVDA